MATFSLRNWGEFVMKINEKLTLGNTKHIVCAPVLAYASEQHYSMLRTRARTQRNAEIVGSATQYGPRNHHPRMIDIATEINAGEISTLDPSNANIEIPTFISVNAQCANFTESYLQPRLKAIDRKTVCVLIAHSQQFEDETRAQRNSRTQILGFSLAFFSFHNDGTMRPIMHYMCHGNVLRLQR